LLPRNPAAFFGLRPGFDLRALKSAYGGLVRRYKPEKAPEEFQRIRAAFESLRLRFDATQGHAAPPPSFREELPPVVDPRPSKKRSRLAVPREEQQPVEPLSIAKRYAIRRAHDQKSFQDYYEIALLADLVDDDGIGFAGWLLAGLRQFPNDPALARLVSAYLTTEEAADNAESLLVALSQAVPDDRFYDITRPLWERLIHAVDFGTFRKLLDACEANLDGDPGEAYVAFSWWVLKRAVWEPDDNWFQAKIADLESHSDLTRWDACRDRDLIDHLIVYRNAREAIVTKGFVRREMDRAVIACTTSSDDVADWRMVEAQQSLASHDRELLREFPPDCEGLDPLVIVWESLSGETASRLGIRDRDVEGDEMARLRGFAADLPTIGWRPVARLFAFWGYCVQWFIKAVIFLVWMAFVLGLGALAIAHVVKMEPGPVVGGVAGLAGVSYAMWLLWDLMSREQSATVAKAHRRLYRRVWRPRIVAFLKSIPVPIDRVTNELLAANTRPNGGARSDRAARIAELLTSDIGLRLFSIATMFGRDAVA
jgi:hypothetical protein